MLTDTATRLANALLPRADEYQQQILFYEYKGNTFLAAVFYAYADAIQWSQQLAAELDTPPDIDLKPFCHSNGQTFYLAIVTGTDL